MRPSGDRAPRRADLIRGSNDEHRERLEYIIQMRRQYRELILSFFLHILFFFAPPPSAFIQVDFPAHPPLPGDRNMLLLPLCPVAGSPLYMIHHFSFLPACLPACLLPTRADFRLVATASPDDTDDVANGSQHIPPISLQTQSSPCWDWTGSLVAHHSA